MSEAALNQINSLDVADQNSVADRFNENTTNKLGTENHISPNDHLSKNILGWYAICSAQTLKPGELYHFSMFNEPLVLYKDKNSTARCIKDLCPHRGASFINGVLRNGELTCPYHGGRFSSEGECLNLDRITCQHIVDSKYNNYAKKIHLFQYPCIEKDDYIFIYYTGNAKTNLNDFEINDSLEDSRTDSYGFNSKSCAYEEVYVDFKCDWTRIIENHLDILHIFWIHGDTIPDKDVNKSAITSFNQKITKDHRHIVSKYHHKSKEKGEFITISFIPPGRIVIYKGTPEEARYLQVLDHIPLAKNRARVIVRHYRKFLKNKLFTKLVLFKQLQHRIFYRIFSEDYMVLKTQTFNQQMGYIKKDNVKLLGEDKMIQYYWDWLKDSLKNEKPWEIHQTGLHTNTVHQDMPMKYPPENLDLANKNNLNLLTNLIIRALIPIGIIIILI